MAGFKNISIRTKLILIQVTTAFIAVLICCAFFLYNDIKIFKASELRTKSSIAQIVGVNLISPILFNDKDAATKILADFKNNPAILNAILIDKTGKKFAAYDKIGEEGFLFPRVKDLIKPKFLDQKFIITYPIYQEKDYVGTLLINAEFIDMGSIFFNYVKGALLVLLAGILVAIIISVFLQRLISKRLLSLVSKTKTISETGNYSIRVSSGEKDEIGSLSGEFNAMLAKIEKSENDLKETNIGLEKKVQERTEDLIKTQKSLQLSEKKYRKMVEEVGDVVYSSDYKGYFTYFNPIIKKVSGYSENELIGKHFLEIVDPEWKDRVAKFYKAQFDGRVSETTFSFPIITKSGEKRWVEQIVTQQKEGDKIIGHNAIVRDITQRRKEEEKLNEYQYFFNNSHDLVSIANKQNYYEIINPNFQKVLGYSEQEILENKILDFVHPDDVNFSVKEIEKLKTGVDTSNFINRYRKKDDSYIWLEWNSSYDQKTGKIYSAARDVTERKKAEDKFRGILESAPDAIIIVDIEGKIQLVNSQAEKLFGYKREEIIGKEVELLIPPQFKHVHPGHRKDFYIDPKVRPMGVGLTLFGLHKSGKEIPVEISLSPIETAEGLLVSAAIRDITEKKKAEEALRNSEIFLNSIVENIPTMLFVKDAKDLKFVRFNKAGEELLGYSKAELIGKSDYDFFPKTEADFFTSKDKKVLESKQLLQIEEEPIHTKYKGVRILETKKIPILDSKGQALYLLGISNDITDLKRILNELDNKTKELERSNKELEQFAYVASHDLQEPLRTISNYVGLLEEEYSESKEESIKQYFTFITSASSRMQTLIKDLLDFSRVGKKPVFVSVDCNKILTEAIAEMDASIKESNAKITYSVLPIVTGIEIELKRVFQNLISNALKFRRKNVSPEIEINAVEKETEFLFSIKDNGIGIEEKSKSKLFVIFQRLENAAEYPGTGIGLATAKKIVNLHGGKIWVESKLGEGSVFYFTIRKKNLK